MADYKMNPSDLFNLRTGLLRLKDNILKMKIHQIENTKGKAASAANKDLVKLYENKIETANQIQQMIDAINSFEKAMEFKISSEIKDPLNCTNSIKDPIQKIINYREKEQYFQDEIRNFPNYFIKRSDIEYSNYGSPSDELAIILIEEDKQEALKEYDKNYELLSNAANQSRALISEIFDLLGVLKVKGNLYRGLLNIDTHSIVDRHINFKKIYISDKKTNLKSGVFYQSSKKFMKNIDLIELIESKTGEKISYEMIDKIMNLTPEERDLFLKNFDLMEDNDWFGMTKEKIKQTLEIMLLYPTRKLNAFSGQNTMELYRFLAEEAIYECFRPEFSKEAYALIHEKLKKLGIEIKPDKIGYEVIDVLEDGTKVVGEPLRIESAAGMQAMAIEINGEVVIIYEGSQTDGNNGITDWVDTNVIGSIKPGVPQQSLDSLQFAEIAMSYYKDKGIENFVVTGHSLAGGAGEYVGNKLDINSVGFDPAPNKEINYNYNKGVTVIPKGGILNHVDIKDGVAVADSNDIKIATTIVGLLGGLESHNGVTNPIGVVKGVLTGFVVGTIIDTVLPNFELIDRNNPNQSTIANDKNGSDPNTTGIYLTNKDFNALDKIDGKEPTRPDDDNDPENGVIADRHISGSV